MRFDISEVTQNSDELLCSVILETSLEVMLCNQCGHEINLAIIVWFKRVFHDT